MAKIQEALDSARALTVMFQHMSTIADALQGMSSLENEEKELRGATEKARKEADAAKKGRDKAVDAENEVVERCKATAAAMEFGAKESADKIVADAKAEAVRITAEAESRLNSLGALVVQATADAAAAEVKRDAVQAELLAAEKAMAAARQKMAKLLEA